MNEFLRGNEGLVKLLGMSAVLLMLVFAVAGAVGISNQLKKGRYIGEDIKSQKTINVSGKGEVYTKPDLVKATFSVVNEANTVSAAMENNTSKMNAVIEAMKAKGVVEKDLKTTNFNIRPRYEWHKPSARLQVRQPEGERVLVGYEITQSLQVKVRDMENVGGVIKAATDAGANQVGNISFTVEDEEAIKEQARKEAIDNAKEKAKKLASQLDVGLVEITGFSEGYSRPRYHGARMEATKAGGAAGATPNIQTGENKVEVNVDITYEID